MPEERIFLSPPYVNGNEKHYVEEAFNSNFIAPAGPMLDAFENDFSAYTNIPYCAAVSSGTAALHLALKVAGIVAGDHVWVSDLTFIGGVSPILYEQAIPSFIDSDPKYWTLSLSVLESALKQAETKGILPKALIVTDIYGQAVDYDAIRTLCQPYNITIISDSAESLGSFYHDRHCGYDADIAIFSFNGNKIITGSSGGMIASHNKKYVEKAKFYATQAKESASYYEHREIGYNYRMSNIIAAIGRAQLETIEERVTKRRSILELYQEALSDIPAIDFIKERPKTRMNAWLSVMTINPEKTSLSPTTLIKALEEQNIESRHAWNPMHNQPVFKKYTSYDGDVAENLFKQGICLPSGSCLKETQQEQVIDIIRNLFG